MASDISIHKLLQIARNRRQRMYVRDEYARRGR